MSLYVWHPGPFLHRYLHPAIHFWKGAIERCDGCVVLVLSNTCTHGTRRRGRVNRRTKHAQKPPLKIVIAKKYMHLSSGYRHTHRQFSIPSSLLNHQNHRITNECLYSYLRCTVNWCYLRRLYLMFDVTIYFSCRDCKWRRRGCPRLFIEAVGIIAV